MALTAQKHTDPFDHWIIDDFFARDLALRLSSEFLDWESSRWFVYDTCLERKRALRDWGAFPSETYRTFANFCSQGFCRSLQDLTGETELMPDMGLHGAGWHMQQQGDHLNLHVDYAIHPLLNMQRKYNLIVYLTPDWQDSWGGDLEFWSHDSHAQAPAALVKKIQPRFNRAVIFDTSSWAWHGCPQPLRCPGDQYRRSLAMYYLTPIRDTTIQRQRARYVPRLDQQGDPQVLALIEQRSQIHRQ